MTSLETFYVIFCEKDDTGKNGYYAIDMHSGGWPYWDSEISRAKKWTSLDSIPTKLDDYMVVRKPEVSIREIQVFATKDIPFNEFKDQVLKAEIDELEKQIAEKRKMLKSQ